MTRPQKRQLATAAFVAVTAALAPALPARADADDPRLDALFERLRDPANTDWGRTEAEIGRIWSQSGSPAMDFLFLQGQNAVAAEDYDAAIEHFSALIDHAPDFAEGWNARATVFFIEEEYALAISDVRQVLRLNPRHFGALSGLAVMFEAVGDPSRALAAMRAAQDLHPHREDVNAAVARLERALGAAEL